MRFDAIYAIEKRVFFFFPQLNTLRPPTVDNNSVSGVGHVNAFYILLLLLS